MAIEVKASAQWRPEYDRGLQALTDLKSKNCYGVYLGKEALVKPWGQVLPAREFFKRLADGTILR